MERLKEGTLLWEPTKDRIENSNLNHYMNWLKKEKNLSFDSYDKLWDLVGDRCGRLLGITLGYFDIQSETPYHSVLL